MIPSPTQVVLRRHTSEAERTQDQRSMEDHAGANDHVEDDCHEPASARVSVDGDGHDRPGPRSSESESESETESAVEFVGCTRPAAFDDDGAPERRTRAARGVSGLRVEVETPPETDARDAHGKSAREANNDDAAPAAIDLITPRDVRDAATFPLAAAIDLCTPDPRHDDFDAEDGAWTAEDLAAIDRAVARACRERATVPPAPAAGAAAFLVLDVETTGLDDGCHVTQLAAKVLGSTDERDLFSGARCEGWVRQISSARLSRPRFAPFLVACLSGMRCF